MMMSKDDPMLIDPKHHFVEDDDYDDYDTPSTSAAAARFEDFNISYELIKGLYVDMRFERLTRIQSLTLPILSTASSNSSHTIFAEAFNGSGKTFSILIGMLSSVDPKLAAPQSLCVCPTRDLAIQSMKWLVKLGKHTSITSELVCVPTKAQYVPLKKRLPVTSQLLIGTAGTLHKLIAAKKLDISLLKSIMVDDVDHLLLEGSSKEDCVRILIDVHKRNPYCKVFVNATILNSSVKAFLERVWNIIKAEQQSQFFVRRDGKNADLIREHKVKVDDESSKLDFVIRNLLELANFRQTVIFVRSKASAAMLHQKLCEAGHNATNVHGAVSQEHRDCILEEFYDGFSQHLITSDVHARGFHLAQVNMVINFDMPIPTGASDDDCETYVHRIGRVGRHGTRGGVFNLLCGDMDMKLMEKIEQYQKKSMIEVQYNVGSEALIRILKHAGL